MVAGYNTVSTQNPQQQQISGQYGHGLSSMMPKIMQYLQGLLEGSPESSAAFEAPYMREFNEKTLPGIAETYAGMGATSSSGFQQALGQAGAGLQENLARLREGLKFGAAEMGQRGAESYMNMNTQALVPKQQSFVKNLLLNLFGGAGQGAAHLMNPLSWR